MRKMIRWGSGLSPSAMVWVLLIPVVIVAVIFSASVGRQFFGPGNITSVLSTTSVLGFVAIGQTLVILVRSLDLSVAYVVSLCSLIAAETMNGEASRIGLAIGASLGIALVIGLVNGFLVAVVGLNGFIATLGVGLIISGYLATQYQGNAGQSAREFLSFGSASLGMFPVSTLVMLGLALIVWWMLNRTRTGAHMYAVGGNPQVAFSSGVRTVYPVVLSHVLCSLFAGVAGLLIAARLGVGSPLVGTQGSYDLLSIAAVVLGGMALSGGRGGVMGTLGGVLILAIVDNIMGTLQIDPFLKDVVRGTVIIVAVAVYARRSGVHRLVRFPHQGAAVAPAPAMREGAEA